MTGPGAGSKIAFGAATPRDSQLCCSSFSLEQVLESERVVMSNCVTHMTASRSNAFNQSWQPCQADCIQVGNVATFCATEDAAA